MGELTDKIKGVVNEVVGNAKQESDDPATRASGVVQETKGKAQNVEGNAKGALGDNI